MTAKWRSSIRGKLIQITMIVCLAAVTLACVFSVVQDLVDERQELDTQLETFGRLISAGSEAALAFNDRKAAEEALSVLRLNPAFIGGGVYTAHGALFAKYSGATVPAPARLPRTTLDTTSEAGRVELVVPVTRDGERAGFVYLIADQRDERARLEQDAAVTAATLLACLSVALILSSRLHKRVTGPVVELARIAAEVSERKDYSVRATPRNAANSGNEIANLIAGFNGMLTEIEQRDDRLLLIQTHLEKAVVCRTEELTVANEELLAAKNAAEKIAEVNVQLARESALILNNATDGILGIGLDNRATFINPAGSRMLGMTLSELQKKSIHESIHHSYPDGRPWPEADCTNTLQNRPGQAFGIIEDTFWRPDGTSLPVEYSSQPMFDESGAQVGGVVIFRDVTERRAVERLKSEFVSTVSHELRTPLTSIRGALGLLGSGLLGTIGDKGKRMLDIAVSNTDRLVRLINDILDIERIGSGKSELSRRHVDAHAVMVQALEGVLSMADQAGVRLAIERSAGDLWGDTDRIVQTLTNLLGNAIKFSPRDTTVTVSGAANGSEFVFCVSDQGRGIPEEKLETIFERFSQVDASDSRDKGGSGLGLAICQSIVRAHGGRIWAEKNDPVGSRFQFTIPLAVAPVATPERDDPAHAIDLVDCSEPTVLVVEDDLDLARVMTTSLQNHGIRTLHASNGNDAIELSTQHVPNLIVLDPGLPDMSGFAVIAALRNNAALARIPILVYSALEVGSADQARLRLGHTEFLTKSRCTPAEFERHVIRLIAAVTSGSQHAA
jgi:PAS domain S-box-containing protein